MTGQTAMSKTILRAEEVHKTYHIGRRSVEVLHGVSLTIHRGETISIMGASGAGKSTLMHILGGLDRPDSGDIFFEDTSLVKMNPAKRAAFRAKRCGFIFQSYHLLPELDVLQNVILPSMAVGNGRDVKARAEELLEKVGLAGRMDHRPMELSGGEQQRVAIARALMNDPDLILADEPTGNLDSHTGENILNNLFDLAQSATRTLIIVTHNDAVARRCQRELVLKDGKLEE
jgi:predicted ABC-type transport system involved in lysophospholipase L1 biosynthesis ATPase subunit